VVTRVLGQTPDILPWIQRVFSEKTQLEETVMNKLKRSLAAFRKGIETNRGKIEELEKEVDAFLGQMRKRKRRETRPAPIQKDLKRKEK
jgi:hypothetical protein